jgi:predicted nucleic acid-binding protein
VADSLIAQSCLDTGIALFTHDRDFRAFAQAASLDVVFDALLERFITG